MSYLLFIDESGHDKHDSPYEVLAGIIVQDRDVWNLITDLNNLEERIFGIRYSKEKEEIKGKKFLKRKVFRLAEQSEIFEDDIAFLRHLWKINSGFTVLILMPEKYFHESERRAI